MILAAVILFPVNDAIPHEEESLILTGSRIPTEGEVHALLIFASYADFPQGDLPAWSDKIFDESVPYSLTHYYLTQSNSRHRITGDVYPSWVYSDHDFASSTKNNLLHSVLGQVDKDVDFSKYDNLNSSGEYKSNNIVDMIILVIAHYPSNPTDKLQLSYEYVTDDSLKNDPVKIKSNSGTMQNYQSAFENQVGIIAHEYGHNMTLQDLYDPHKPSTIQGHCGCSAGLGKWCLMAEGYGSRGLYPLSAYCKESLNWLEVETLLKTTYNIRMNPCKAVKFRVPCMRRFEYFLVSYRDGTDVYSASLPTGVLIWHIDESPGVVRNQNEFHKRVDLECADGLFHDRGYPGSVPDPISGGDNLDFYSRWCPVYCDTAHGNMADSTDPFDGVSYTRFTPYTNPNSNGYGEIEPNKQIRRTHIAVLDIEPDGTFDLVFNYWEGELDLDTVWEPEDNPYYLGSDITVPRGVSLTVRTGVEIEYNNHSIFSTGGEIHFEDYTAMNNSDHQQPVSFELKNAYPNPFNASTRISFHLMQSATISLKIFDALGREVRTLINDHRSAGDHSCVWDGNDDYGNPASSGLYFARLSTKSRYEVKKMMLVR
jgi:M6 family metalloprotease-like protein